MKKQISAISEKLETAIYPLFEKIGTWTKLQKIMIFAGSLLLLVGAVVYFLYIPKYTQIEFLKSEHENLEKQLTTAKIKARQLEKYQKKMEDARARFNLAMRALPNKEEIPSLLAAISRAGRDAALDFLLFQPNAEVNKEFYAEIPVRIEVTGSYHQTAIFFDKVSRLSRVVHIRDIKINSNKNSSKLKTSCAAVTYKFIDVQKKTKSRKKRR